MFLTLQFLVCFIKKKEKDRFLFLALVGCCVVFCLVAVSWGSCLVGGTRASHCGDLSFLGPWALGRAGFSESRLMGSSSELSSSGALSLVAPGRVRSSQTSRDGTYVSCISRWILAHWTHQESPRIYLFIYLFLFCLAVPGTQLRHSGSAIFIVVCRIFLISSSLTRDRTAGPLHWECWSLSQTGPPDKSLRLHS